jgi:prepilin-type N-terminal cleavage/methylation domain-containing protein
MNKFKKGFTLIELLVVIALIGILSGFVIVSMNGATNAANDVKRKANLDTIKKAAIMVSIANGGYPVETGCTIGSCSTLDPLIREYIPSVVDGTYTYESDGSAFTLSSTLSSGYSYQFDSSTNTYSTNTPVNAACGSSSGANLSSIPTTNLCNVGVASVVSGTGPWNWTCAGSSGGTNASCASVNLPVAGVCGSKNGKYASSAPTGTEACATGTATGMTGTYSWTCAGLDGGASSGACATVAANYGLQTYSTVGTYSWTVPAGVTSVEYLVIAGGGGGYNGWYGGGGGAGGMLTGTGYAVTPGVSISITVGAGGAGGTNGSNSVFGTLTAIGGGTASCPGVAGGSGGGASACSGAVGGAGTSSQGYAGGTPGYGCGYGNDSGGGGGGAGGVGGNSPGCSTAGVGGPGRASSITGTSVYYAGGGGGGGATPAAGGIGGGGNGNGGAATNYGGGGAGTTSAGTGGAGYRGIVIIKYLDNY